MKNLTEKVSSPIIRFILLAIICSSVALLGQTKDEDLGKQEVIEVIEVIEDIERKIEGLKSDLIVDLEENPVKVQADPVGEVLKKDAQEVHPKVQTIIEEERALEKALNDMDKKAPEERAAEEAKSVKTEVKMKQKGAVEAADISTAVEKKTYITPPVTVRFRTPENQMEATFGIRMPGPKEDGYKPWQAAQKMRTLKIWQDSTKTKDPTTGQETVDTLKVFLTPDEQRSTKASHLFFRLKKYEIDYEVITIDKSLTESIERDFEEVTKSKWTHIKEQVKHAVAPGKSNIEMAYLMTGAATALNVGAFVGIPMIYGTSINPLIPIMMVTYTALTTFYTTAFMQRIDRMVGKRYTSPDPMNRVGTLSELIRRVVFISTPITATAYGLANLGYPTGAFYAIMGAVLAGAIPGNLFGTLRAKTTDINKGVPSYIKTPEDVRFWNEKFGGYLNFYAWFGSSVFYTLEMANIQFFDPIQTMEITGSLFGHSFGLAGITLSSQATLMAGFLFLISAAVVIPQTRRLLYVSSVKFHESFTKQTDKIKSLVNKIKGDSMNKNPNVVNGRFSQLLGSVKKAAKMVSNIKPDLVGSLHIKQSQLKKTQDQMTRLSTQGRFRHAMELIPDSVQRMKTCHSVL